MSDSVQLDLALLLPGVPDAGAASVDLLAARVSALEGVERVHVVPAAHSQPARVCVHYERGAVARELVRRVAREEAARLIGEVERAPAGVDGAASPKPTRTRGPLPDPRAAGRPDAAIELHGVARRYRVGEVTVTALEDATLTVAPGEFAVILGPSGSGKTTLLNMIGALDTPTAGRVVVGGRDITRASRRELFRFRRESVAFIFQTFNLFPALTAVENVEFGVEVAGRGGGRQLAARTLERVGLGSRLDHFPHELSGGEQQRVAIARAVATGSPVLLADEPTGELDFRTGVQILELLREQAGDGRCVLVVTHNREISRIADRVIELSSGRIVADGPPPGGRPAEIADLRW